MLVVSCPAVDIATRHLLKVALGHPLSARRPGWHVVGFLLVDLANLLVSVTDPHDVVKTDAGEDDVLDRAGVLLKPDKQTAEAVSQYTESILLHSPSSRHSIVKDYIQMVQVTPWEKHHQPGLQGECFVSNNVVGDINVIMLYFLYGVLTHFKTFYVIKWIFIGEGRPQNNSDWVQPASFRL